MQPVDFYFWMFVTFCATFAGYTAYMLRCVYYKEYKAFFCLVILQVICMALIMFCLSEFREELHKDDNICNLPISVD